MSGESNMRRIIFLAFILAMFVFVGCSSNENVEADTNVEYVTETLNDVDDVVKSNEHRVDIKETGYNPDTLIVSKGDTVVFTNIDKDSEYYRVLFDQDVSKNLKYGDSFVKVFENEGVFMYQNDHGNVFEGKIIVE
jgi:plastocyanin